MRSHKKRKEKLWFLVQHVRSLEVSFCPNDKEKAEQTEKLATFLRSVREVKGCVCGGGEAEGVWELSVLDAQFCYEPKTILKVY